MEHYEGKKVSQRNMVGSMHTACLLKDKARLSNMMELCLCDDRACLLYAELAHYYDIADNLST